MCASIIRVEGDIIHQPAELKNLEKFLRQQSFPRILISSALTGFYELTEKELDKVREAGYSSAAYELQLNQLFKNRPSSESHAGTKSLVTEMKNLLKGIHLTGDYSPALKDQLLSYGEKITALVLSEQLKEMGREAAVIQPEELGLKVTSDPGNATFLALSHPELIVSGNKNNWIIPGSFGINGKGKIARTGAAAADYTAAFLTAELSADRLILWNLRDGFSIADPSVVPEAERLKRLTYAEASELAYFDHFSLHPRTVEPLSGKHIPIHIINSSQATHDPETIINSEDYISPGVVKSVACTDDISILKLNGPGVGLKPGILARLTGRLADAAINIKSVITSQVSINILLDRKSGPTAVKVAAETGFSGVSEIELLGEVSLIAIIGHGMQDHYGISATLFSAVAQNKINVIISGSGASDLVSYLVVRTTDKEKGVRAIYDAFLKPSSPIFI